MSALPAAERAHPSAPRARRVLMLSPDAQMIDRRILQEARTLVRAGHEVTVLSGFECARPDAYEDRGVRVKRYAYDWSDRRRARLVARLGPRAGRAVWPLVRLLNRLRGGPTAHEDFVLGKALEHEYDVVHVHDFPVLRVGALAAAARGARLVYDSHEFYPVQACFPPRDQRRYLARERALLPACDAVITVNPYIADLMASTHGVPPPRVILNACEPPPLTAADLTPDERRAARGARGMPPDAFVFAYQGWLSPERNLEPMVEAAARLPAGAHLLVVGYGDHLADLERVAERSGATGRVTFAGRVESDELPALTRLCDVGVIPYRAVDEMHRYCSPNKLFEFVASRLPVLASDLPYLRDVIAGRGIGWLGDLGTVEGFDAMFRAVLDDAEGLARARANLPAAAAALSWDVEGEKLLAIYDALGPARGLPAAA